VLRGVSASGRTERWQPALLRQSAGDGLAHSKHGRVIQTSDGRLADRAKMWLATQQMLGGRDALRIWIRWRRMSRLLRRFGCLRRRSASRRAGSIPVRRLQRAHHRLREGPFLVQRRCDIPYLNPHVGG